MKRSKLYIVTSLLLVLSLVIFFWIFPREGTKSKQYTRLVLSQVESALIKYGQDCKKFPEERDGLKVLTQINEHCENGELNKPYFSGRLVDGNGMPFVYQNDNRKILVGSKFKNSDQLEVYFECDATTFSCREQF